jgi:dTDP-4-amino-4,6-dideoxygalactose transaminase
MTGKELYYIADAHFKGHLAGDGMYTRRCHEWLERKAGAQRAFLTHSCTAALELAALLLDLKADDEIIMPSYTFVSTANAFVLRGAKPVFVDIRPDTFNLDETKVEAAITNRTKAIVPVHYAGVACEMDTIMTIATKHHLHVIEDAAQGVMSAYKGKALGSIGHLGTYSFHETKNIISGEGGALLVNRPEFVERAEVLREKGTDRNRFYRGQVDKYTWQDVGSSFLPGELIAAFLCAQLEEAVQIAELRRTLWNYYHKLIEPLEVAGFLRRPVIPDTCEHNAHMYYVLLNSPKDRDRALAEFRQRDIDAVFHYVPLHSSPAGQRFGRTNGTLLVTDSVSARLIRLPMWVGLSTVEQDRVYDVLHSLFLNETKNN